MMYFLKLPNVIIRHLSINYLSEETAKNLYVLYCMCDKARYNMFNPIKSDFNLELSEVIKTNNLNAFKMKYNYGMVLQRVSRVIYIIQCKAFKLLDFLLEKHFENEVIMAIIGCLQEKYDIPIDDYLYLFSLENFMILRGACYYDNLPVAKKILEKFNINIMDIYDNYELEFLVPNVCEWLNGAKFQSNDLEMANEECPIHDKKLFKYSFYDCSCPTCADCMQLLDNCECERCEHCENLVGQCCCRICGECINICDCSL